MNLKDIFNAFKGTKAQEHEQAVLKMVNAIKNQRSLYKKEIREYKIARANALDPNYPRRGLLIDIFEDILGDAFIFGRAETRKLRVSNKSVSLTNAKGEIDEEKSKFFQKKWFNDFVKYTIESIYFGYTLIYPDVLDENGHIKEITKVFRDHIVPEKRIILENRGDMQGQSFDELPLSKWVVWVNHKQFLGLLDKAALLWIFKKHSWQNWDEFEEMFGIPMRTAKVASTDPRVKREVDKWLKDLGSAGWARFPEGVDIDIKESQSRDSFNVFNEKRKACNEELATLFDGHSETAKDTGSRAKAGSIIESTQDLITQDDETLTLSVINDQLLPLMRYLGYPIAEDDEVRWNENTKTEPKDRLQIFKGVKDLGYRVKKEQIETELDIEIVGEYTPTPPTPQNRHRQNFKSPHNHTGGCGANFDYKNVDLSILKNTRDLTDDEIAFLKKLYENPESINWSYNEFKASHYALLEALKKGAPVLNYDFGANDHNRMRIWMDNVFRFGCDKTQAQVHELNEIRKNCKTFQEFRNKVKGVFPKYKEHYLHAEWQHANAVSSMGTKQQEMMEDIDDAPYWKFSAILDDGTTEVCKHLDGKVFRKDDKKAWKFIPPLHWRCRSDSENVLSGYDGEVISFEDAITLDPDGYERMQKQGFNVNWGDPNELFNASQSYLKSLNIEPINVDTLTAETYGLSAFENIKKHKKKNKKSKLQRFIDKTGMARIITAQELPVWLDAKKLNVTDETFTRVKETLQMPNEVYWSDSNGLKTQRFFRFYEDGAMEVQTESVKVTKISLLKNPDNVRKGLLVFTPKDHSKYYEKIYKSYDKTWRKEYFNNGGFVVINKDRITKSNVSKREQIKFEKEKAMALVYAQNGYRIELWDEIAGISSPDGSLNSITVDFKSVATHNNIVKYAKKAIRKQGAEIVLFEFTNETEAIHKEILALKKIGIKAMYYFTDTKEVYNNF